MGGSIEVGRSSVLQDFFRAAALGKVPGVSADVKFGYGTAFDNGILSTVWPGVDLVAPFVPVALYVPPVDAGEAVEILSGNAADLSIPYKIFGLDENGDPQTVTVSTDAVDGTTPVAVPGLWSSVERVFNSGAVAAVGQVVVRGDTSTSTNIFAIVLPVDQQTVQAFFRVPRGKVAMVVNYSTALNKAGAVDASGIMRLQSKRAGGVYRTGIRYGLQRGGVSNISSDLIIPEVLPQFTRTEIRTIVTTSAGTGDVSGEISYLLFDNTDLAADFLALLEAS